MTSIRGFSLASTALSSVSLAQSWYIEDEEEESLIISHSGYDFSHDCDQRRHIPNSSHPSHPARHHGSGNP